MIETSRFVVKGEEEDLGHEIQNTKEIEFLLTCLVDAENRTSRRIVLEKLLPLLPFGYHPILFIEEHADPAIRHKLRQSHAHYLNEIKMRLDIKRLMGSSKEPDLEQGAFLISRLGGEEAWTPKSFKHELDRLAKPLLERKIYKRAKDEQLSMFVDYVFRELGFTGNAEDYYNPKNSFLTEVLRSRQGIPVSLGVLCLLLARRVRLPLQGVNMPGHFLLLYSELEETVFLDPFHGGESLSAAECLLFLERQHIRPSMEYLEPTDHLSILKRMYRNLISYYSNARDRRQEKMLRQHFAILEDGASR